MTDEERIEMFEDLMDFGLVRIGVDGMFFLGNLEFVRQTGGIEVIRILGKLVAGMNAEIDRSSLVHQRGQLPYFHFRQDQRRQMNKR